MRVVFLDIDGVLNQGYDAVRGAPSGFDYAVPSAVLALNGLTRATGAVLVVSSAWRLEMNLDGLRDVLRGWGVEAEAVDVTPELDDASGFPAARLAEIRAWLDLNGEGVSGFVVLDDNNIQLDINNDIVRDDDIEERFVRTVTKSGLTEEDALQAARALLRTRRQKSA